MPTHSYKDFQAAKIAFYERKFRLIEDMDAVLEQCFKERKDLAAAVGVVFECLSRHLAPEVMFIRTLNEELVMTTYPWGVVYEVLAKNFNDLFQVSSPTKKVAPGFTWFAIPLDMAGETVGSMGMAFPRASDDLGDKEIFQLMDAAAEELDSFLYGIQENRRKHEFIMDVQKALSSRNLSQAIESAVDVMLRVAPIQDLFLLYFDENPAGKTRPMYMVFRDGQKLFDSDSAPIPGLDELLRPGILGAIPDNDQLAPFFPVAADAETVLLYEAVEPYRIGELVFNPTEGGGFSIFVRELIQTFSESLRQRLVDFDREKNVLRRNFSPPVTTRPLEMRDYRTRFLSSRTAKIGILTVDICGFSSVAENLMQLPDRLSQLIDGWSAVVLEVIFREGGALDKMVGDSLIALFGPPFYEFDQAETVNKLVRSALSIRSTSREFFVSDKNRDLQNLENFQKLGVVIGLNFCKVLVGMIGPTRALTALGGGMTDTIHLQESACFDEIFVTGPVKEFAEKAQPGLWRFSGPFSADRRFQKEPLPYFKLSL